ncbi:hypothetical protein N0V95_000724 [Ascochyta clinopodiicola]|nr:hypothetical protein N0V95_000724 [Ascochyta clinopodiicola]
MWARLGIGKNAGWDDTLMSLAIIPLFGLTISAVLAIRIYGFQWHVWDQTKETLVTARQVSLRVYDIGRKTDTTVQDFIICLLPVFLIWNLRITKTQKFALCGIFALGLVTCICGILRTYYATYVYYRTYDITWYAYYGWIWTALEADLAVVCASAPALKMFFRRYFNMTTSRSDYAMSEFGSRKTPIPLLSKAEPRSKECQVPASRIDAGGLYDDLPMNRIKVSQGLDVQIDARDDASQRSFASTRKLAALPALQDDPGQGSSPWRQGCRTVCAALRPLSRGALQARSQKTDVEIGTAR